MTNVLKCTAFWKRDPCRKNLISQIIQQAEDQLQELKTRKIQKRREVDDRATEIEEIRKETAKINKVGTITASVGGFYLVFVTLA